MTHFAIRTTRMERIALIAAAILEAILIFGVVVPTVLKRSNAADAPQPTTGVHHE